MGSGGKGMEQINAHLTSRKKKSLTVSEWKWYRNCSGIEPIIVYVKRGHRMDRCFLNGEVDE